MHNDIEEVKEIPGATRTKYTPSPGANGKDHNTSTGVITTNLSTVVVTNPFEPEDIDDFLSQKPPPREWLLGTVICRTFLTVIAAAGGSGKSALIILWAIALTTKRTIAGFHAHKRARVLVLTFEDTADEYRRRFFAAFQHHGISPSEAKGFLFVKSLNGIGITIGSVESVKGGGMSVLPTSAPAMIEEVITRLQIDAVTLDPFVKCAGVPENDNVAVDAITRIISSICERKNVAFIVAHHKRKGQGEPGDMDSTRGASSLVDGARVGLTLTPMSEVDAKMYNISDEERRRLIRLDDGKLNLSLKANPAWYRLASVNIGNGTDDYPSGDNIQALEAWTPPDMWEALPEPTINAILNDFENGMENGEQYSYANRAAERAAWLVIMEHVPTLTKDQAMKVLKTWVKSGMIESRKYTSPKTRKSTDGIVVLKRPG